MLVKQQPSLFSGESGQEDCLQLLFHQPRLIADVIEWNHRAVIFIAVTWERDKISNCA